MDAAGVSPAAIQGLNEIVTKREDQNAEMQARLTALDQVTRERPDSNPPPSSLLPWVLVAMLAGALMGVVTAAVSFAFTLRKRLPSVP